MKKVLKVFLALTLVVVMFVIGTETALADSNESGGEAEGVITAADKTATPPTVSIKLEEGDTTIILKVDASTVITKKGLGNITINDLAINDKVTVNYNRDTMVASRIAVSQPLGKRHSFEGTIKSKVDTTLVVTTKKGDETFKVNSDTEYKVPGMKNAALDNFKIGNKVSVSTREVTISGTVVQVAQRLTLIPGKPIKVKRTGIITAYVENTSITVQDKKGNSTTFIIDANTKISLKKGVTGIAVGDQATISARRYPAESQFTAKTIRDFGTKSTDHGKNK
jgi:hypothetical protein